MKTIIQIILILIIPIIMNAQKTTFFVGTTDRNIEKAVAIFHLDEKTGDMELFKRTNAGTRPGYLALSNDKSFLFAVSSENFEGLENEQSINAFRINDEVSEFSPINQQPSRGKNPTHISVNPVYDIVYTANYNSGSVASYAFDETGRLTPPLSSYQHEGSGPNTDRQKGPHAHYIHASMNGKYVYSADLGIDKIMIYKQGKNGEIAPNENQEFLQLDPGSGPRHMAFHDNGKWAFILTELSNEVVACKINNEDGSLEMIDKKSTLDEEPSVYTKAAAIRIHPNGKYLYASNRGINSIAVFEIMDDGRLTSMGNYFEDIGVVRDFNISPSGKYLIAGNQDKNEIVLLKIDEDGSLQSTGKTLPVSQPSCILFYN